MKPIVLFRREFNQDTESEFLCAEKHLTCTESRVGIQDKLVVGRYSVLPFYGELEHDLHLQGSELINNRYHHSFVADFHWYEIVKNHTPPTWFRLEDVPKEGGPFVVKGRTNSRKFEWDKKMFAPDFRSVINIETELMQDGLIGPQGVVIRKFIPLKVLEVGLHGLPFSNEWRFFFLRDQLLTHGFYWSASERKGTMNDKGMAFAHMIANKLKSHVNFFVVDIAETAQGNWILIEVNDGQMSGLSECNPDELYSNLQAALRCYSTC